MASNTGSPFEIKVMTFNIGGGSPPDNARAKKKQLIQTALHNFTPDIVLIQENLWRGGNIEKQVELDAVGDFHTVLKANNIGNIHGTECMLYIGYNNQWLARKHIEEIDKLLVTEIMVDELQLKYFLGDKGQFDHIKFHSRCKIAVFHFEKLATGGHPPVMFISWHGYYKGVNLQQKKDAFEDLMKLTYYFHTNKQLAVVIGGDFNVEMEEVKNIIGKYGFVTQTYDLPPHRSTLIDFYVVTPPYSAKETPTIPGIVLKSTKAKPFSNDDPKGLIFDHVPVISQMNIVKQG